MPGCHRRYTTKWLQTHPRRGLCRKRRARGRALPRTAAHRCPPQPQPRLRGARGCRPEELWAALWRCLRRAAARLPWEPRELPHHRRPRQQARLSPAARSLGCSPARHHLQAVPSPGRWALLRPRPQRQPDQRPRLPEHPLPAHGPRVATGTTRRLKVPESKPPAVCAATPCYALPNPKTPSCLAAARPSR